MQRFESHIDLLALRDNCLQQSECSAPLAIVAVAHDLLTTPGRIVPTGHAKDIAHLDLLNADVGHNPFDFYKITARHQVSDNTLRIIAYRSSSEESELIDEDAVLASEWTEKFACAFIASLIEANITAAFRSFHRNHVKV